MAADRLFRGLPRGCLTVCRMLSGMSIQSENLPKTGNERVVGVFGDARLVESSDGLHLEGGSMADRVEAQEWAAVHLRKRLLVRRPSCRPAR